MGPARASGQVESLDPAAVDNCVVYAHASAERVAGMATRIPGIIRRR
ncbi:hypothetical protein [Sciscionella sediminilitoris]|nr:hypothetical protein [Sciscionella sp. SE31]